jgi:hypothetical protein
VLPALVRAAPAAAVIGAAALAVDRGFDAPSLIALAVGAVVTTAAATAALWAADWEELESVRQFLQRRRRVATAPE